MWWHNTVCIPNDEGLDISRTLLLGQTSSTVISTFYVCVCAICCFPSKELCSLYTLPSINNLFIGLSSWFLKFSNVFYVTCEL